MKTILAMSALAASMIGGSAVMAVPSEAQAQSVPSGSYQRSCRDAWVRNDTLSARCQNYRGDWNSSSLNLRNCRDGDITNENGRLTCDRRGGGGWNGNGGWNGGGHGGGWGGGGRDSVTVYRDENYRGSSRSFEGAVPDLGRAGFNDTISSMRFRGTWEACTDAYYRGQCRTFRDDISNLRWSNMNDRISSLRPAGRY